MQKLRKATSVTVLAATSLTLSACSVSRVNEVKDQFCDFDSNFSYDTGSQPHFTFEQPVLLESDVATLIGYEPAETILDNGHEIHRYVIEKYTPDQVTGEQITLDLHYRYLRGSYRLSAIHLPPDMGFGEELALANDPGAIADAARKICNASVSFRFGPMEEDIDPSHLAALPDRNAILSMMGEPSWESEEENALIYLYRFQGDQDDDNPIKMVVWFDESNTRPLRMETNYRFVKSEADFKQGKMRYSYSL